MLNQAIVYANCNKLFVDVMSFGDWLRQKIKDKNLSNAEVARRANVSPTYIGNLVRDFAPNTKSGKGRPSEEVLADIVKAVSGNLNEARLAAGYAPLGESAIPEELAGLFHGAEDWSPKKREAIIKKIQDEVNFLDKIMPDDDEEERDINYLDNLHIP